MNYLKLRRKVLEKFFGEMNDMQQQAIFTVNGPLLLLAGAGSGKTSVLVNRAANLILFGNAYMDENVKHVTDDDLNYINRYIDGGECNVDRLSNILSCDNITPWSLLVITFTNKAAGELRERLSKMLGDKSNDINAATFHSACVRILRREIEALGYKRGFTIYDSDDSQRVIKDVLKRLNISEKQFAPKMVLGEISRAKDKLIDSTTFSNTIPNDYRLIEIAKIYKEYQLSLKSANALDFDDIIMLTVKLFEICPDVLLHYQRLYKYIMVDEYQDTSHAQYRLISLLSESHKNLCVVGDDDQSIYRFRGATIENILSFEKQFKDCRVIKLEQNYRSTSNILNAANEVIKNNTARKPKKLWTDLGEGEKINVHRVYDEQQEAKAVIDEIIKGKENGLNFSDNVVLYRTNAQSRTIEIALSKNAIPYRIIGGVRFYDRKEIKDVIAYLSVLSNPFDMVRFKRIINEPKRGIGDMTVSEIDRIASGLGISVIDVMINASEYERLLKKSSTLKSLGEVFVELIKMADELPLNDLIDIVLDKTGYLAHLRLLGDEGVARIENIDEFKSNVLEYTSENPEFTLNDFLEQVSLISDLDNFNTAEDKVCLMTMHSAKGLEFDTVYLIGAEDNLFPSYRSIGEAEELEEERRLAYVAITRAKRRLFIYSAEQRTIFGQTNRNKMSRFIREIPEELIAQNIQIPVVKVTRTKNKPKQGYLQRQSAPVAVKSGESFEIGNKVEHNIFGQGTVLNAVPAGNDVMLEIAFEKVGTKKIMANFAKVKKI